MTEKLWKGKLTEHFKKEHSHTKYTQNLEWSLIVFFFIGADRFIVKVVPETIIDRIILPQICPSMACHCTIQGSDPRSQTQIFMSQKK